MKRCICFIILTVLSFHSYSQEDSTTGRSQSGPRLIKKQQSSQTISEPQLVYRSNGGMARIHKLSDSLYEYTGWGNSIYLTKENIIELKEAAKMIRDAETDDKVSLNSFRCDITKGKLIGTVYWMQFYKQKSSIDFSGLSSAEITAILKTSAVESVKDENGNPVANKARVVQYEEALQRFGISNKDLQKILEMK